MRTILFAGTHSYAYPPLPKILLALQLSLQNDDLITGYPDLKRATCCNLDVSMLREGFPIICIVKQTEI